MWDNLNVHLGAELRAFTGAQAWLRVFRLPAYAPDLNPVEGIWYLLRRRGWTCQLGARRAIERDDGAVEVWKKETWPRIKAPRRPSAAGSSSKTSAASR